jgi:hypothetical protein
VESPEKPSSPARVAEQPKVVAKHDDGVELTKSATDSRNGTNARIAHSAQQARFDRERRDVNGDDIVTATLQIQRDTSRPAAHIEDSATNLPYGSPLNGWPPLERGKIGRRPCRNIEPAIVTFDDLSRRQALVVSVNKPAASVCIQGHDCILTVAVERSALTRQSSAAPLQCIVIRHSHVIVSRSG